MRGGVRVVGEVERGDTFEPSSEMGSQMKEMDQISSRRVANGRRSGGVGVVLSPRPRRPPEEECTGTLLEH